MEDMKKEEILLLIEQRKSATANRILNYAKMIIGIVGAVVVFIWIQSPDSLLSRKATQEEINRERAKLILDVLDNDNYETQAISLKIIRLAYQGNDETSTWIDESIKEFEKQSLNRVISEIESELRGLLIDRNNRSREIHEMTDLNSTKYILTKSELDAIKVKIELVENKLSYFKEMLNSL